MALEAPGGPLRADQPGHNGYLDLFYRRELWEEPLICRPWRKVLVPLPPEIAGAPQTKRVIAWLASYHQSHSWQLMEALGCSEYSFSRTIRPLFTAGLLARGRLNPYNLGAMPYVYQLHPGAPLRAWVRDLNYLDWLGVTGGPKLSWANYPRHNMLVVELALAASRLLDSTVAVLGEPYATAIRMVPGSTNRSIGDAVLVLSSGLRVVVELVANMGEDVQRKIVRWGRLLTSATTSQLGTVVLLLNAAAPARQKALTRHLRRMVLAGLDSNQLGTAGAWVSDRETAQARAAMYIASWPEWFSPGGTTTLEFATLQAWRATPDSQFALSSILAHPFRPRHPEEWQDPAHNLPWLLATPEALRIKAGLAVPPDR